MNRRVSKKKLYKYYYFLVFGVITLVLLGVLKTNTDWVERYYSQMFYPKISYLYLALFSWIPFSVGDVLYAFNFSALGFLIVKAIYSLFKKRFADFKSFGLQLLCFILLLNIIFDINWGLNYYRYPVAKHFNLELKDFAKEEYLTVLEKYIHIANDLREDVDLSNKTKLGVAGDIVELVKKDSLLTGILSKTQIRIKQPFSNTVASYFTVSGYFNPFSHEANVNALVPNAGYPFTCVHELAHQQGIGFEDDCNFIAFMRLKDSQNKWYRYSAYYTTIQYLFRPLYKDEILFEKYRNMLSAKVLQDFKEERLFWENYRGWIDQISSKIYNQYLMANNQPEGLERYNMMVRMVLAYEKSVNN